MSNNDQFPGVKQGTVSPMSQKCADCGAWFRASDHPDPRQALREHKQAEHGADADAPQTTVLEETYEELASKPSKKDRAKQTAKTAGGGIATLFDSTKEKLSLGWGAYLGIYWGHAPDKAEFLILGTLAVVVGVDRTFGKAPMLPTNAIDAVRENLIQFILGLLFGLIVIISMHFAGLDAPVALPGLSEVFDTIYHLAGSHNHAH